MARNTNSSIDDLIQWFGVRVMEKNCQIRQICKEDAVDCRKWRKIFYDRHEGGVCLFVCSLRAEVRPTLDPSAETVSRSNALAQGERRGIGWCMRVCA